MLPRGSISKRKCKRNSMLSKSNLPCLYHRGYVIANFNEFMTNSPFIIAENRFESFKNDEILQRK